MPTKIEWTDETWNPIGGCSLASPGCKPCYAMRLAGTRLKKHPLYSGTTSVEKGRPVFNGKLTVLPDNHPTWTMPVRWGGAKEPKLGRGKPSLIFAGDMSDVAHENRATWQFRRMLAIAVISPHIVQFLTKRPDVMLSEIESILGSDAAPRGFRCSPWSALLNEVERFWARHEQYMEHIRPILMRAGTAKGVIADGAPWNIWLGFSAERQKEFDERWRHMLQLARLGFTIFLSYEPAIGPLVLPDSFLDLKNKAQVIAGGMSGKDWDCPAHAAWFRSVRDQCAAAGVPFFFKQWGEWIDADQWLDQIERGRSDLLYHGKPWAPRRPLNYHDAATLADYSGQHRFEHLCDGTTAIRVGRSAAGNTLDGRQHLEFPEFEVAA